jgi:hypothetical protein
MELAIIRDGGKAFLETLEGEGEAEERPEIAFIGAL